MRSATFAAMSRVPEEEVRALGALARLALSDEEVSTLSADLGEIVAHMDALAEVDTEGVEPMSHVMPGVGHRREDVVEASLPAELALGAAPSEREGCFDVPAILPAGSKK